MNTFAKVLLIVMAIGLAGATTFGAVYKVKYDRVQVALDNASESEVMRQLAAARAELANAKELLEHQEKTIDAYERIENERDANQAILERIAINSRTALSSAKDGNEIARASMNAAIALIEEIMRQQRK